MKYDIHDVKTRANGQWAEILNRIAGIDDDYLSGSPGPCPKCGGNDRWRFSDRDGDGSAICNQCDLFAGDGIAVVEWALGIKFFGALEKVAEFVGVSPRKGVKSAAATSKGKSTGRKSKNRQGTRSKPKGGATLTFKAWNERIAIQFCIDHKPFQLETLKIAGAKLGDYGSLQVIAIPLEQNDGTPAGYTVFRTDGGTFTETNKRTGEKTPLKYRTVRA